MAVIYLASPKRTAEQGANTGFEGSKAVASQGLIREGSGFAKFDVKYACVVFRPFKGEVLDTVVTQVNKVRRLHAASLAHVENILQIKLRRLHTTSLAHIEDISLGWSCSLFWQCSDSTRACVHISIAFVNL